MNFFNAFRFKISFSFFHKPENFHEVLKSSLSNNNTTGYPYYNILKITHFSIISFALAGFSKDDVEILLEKIS